MHPVSILFHSQVACLFWSDKHTVNLPHPSLPQCTFMRYAYTCDTTNFILFLFTPRSDTMSSNQKTRVDITPVDSNIKDTTLSSRPPLQFVTVKKLMTRYCRQGFLLVELHFRPYVHHTRYELSGRVKKAKGFHPTFNIMVTGPVVEL